MKNLWTIIKKELRRFFTDKRMLSALLLPGILIFVLYSIMGDVMVNVGENKGHTYTLRIENKPSDPKYDFDLEIENEIIYLDETPENYAEQLENKELDLLIIYEPDFLVKVAANDPEDPALVVFHYNASSMPSMTIFQLYSQKLNSVLQPFVAIPQDHSTSGDISMMIMTSLLPFLLITFLFSGAMAVAPESIAGEKERGTIANMLITPVKRSTIALGKVVALSMVALVSATSSFFGIVFSLPKLAGTNVDLGVYTPWTYLSILLILITTVFIFIMLISLISAFSKSIKEASGLATPLMILIMVAGITTLFGRAVTNVWLYFIPIFNSVNMLLMLFSGEFALLPFLFTIISNIAVTGLGVYLLTAMFSSEKVMFRK